MKGNVSISKDGKRIVVRLPFTFMRHQRSKRIVVPENTPSWQPPQPQINDSILIAIVRAYRWKGMLDAGQYGTIGDLAKAEKINFSYLSRVLRLSLLSPKITEMILDGRQRATLELRDLLKPFPSEWAEQERVFGPR